jgi:hypothetical protein
LDLLSVAAGFDGLYAPAVDLAAVIVDGELNEGEIMTQPALWTQEQLAQHWLVSEGTLERWRCEGISPVFLKIGGHVRYRIPDIVNTSTNWR